MTITVIQPTLAAMKPHCTVCNEPLLNKRNAMCGNCLAAKFIIQRSASAMMALHGITHATGMCVDCGTRPATCRDHRHYASPLKVDFTCHACNLRRGSALDLIELIKAHRGLIAIEANEPKPIEPERSFYDVPELKPGFDIKKYLADAEKHLITTALLMTNHNKTKAAKLLGVSFRALRYKIEQLKLEQQND